MGLIVSIYRDDYDSDHNLFHGVRSVVVVNVPGPFEPTPERPAARLTRNALGSVVLVPDESPGEGLTPFMFGGTFAASSDSRFRQEVGMYGAVPVHDRVESWDEYRALSI